MSVVDVQNAMGNKVSEIELDDGVFCVPVKSSVLHEVVRMQLVSRRSGTSSVKRRSDVRGSTKKLYRQKGTGRARSGDIKSPLRRGGGVVFGPSPKTYKYKVPKKVRRLALKMALSSKLQKENFFVINDFGIEAIKTKKFMQVIDALKLNNVLIVIDKADDNLELSAKNVSKVKVIRAEGLNVYDILKYENLLFLESSVGIIERRLLS